MEMNTEHVVIILIGLGVSLILFLYYGIRYKRTRQAFFNTANINAATKKEVGKRLRFRDPVISCDYCGAKIDTRKNLVCPKCGASYNKDTEWTSRRNVDESKVDGMSGRVYDDLSGKASWKQQPELKSLRRKIFLSALPLLAAIVLVAFVSIRKSILDYRGDETLQSRNFSGYREADFKVKGDEVIYDDGDIAIAITGFYVGNDKRDNGKVAVGMRVTNRTDKKLEVDLKCTAVNGVTGGDVNGFFVLDKFRKNRDTVIYESFSGLSESTVFEMVITQLDVWDNHRRPIHSIEAPIVVTTTAETAPKEIDLDGLQPLYSNDKVEMYCRYEERSVGMSGYVLYIVNKTDRCMIVQNETRLDAEYPYLFLYEEEIPAGYIYSSNREKITTDLYGTANPEVSFLIRFPEGAGMSFSTGKLRFGE